MVMWVDSDCWEWSAHSTGMLGVTHAIETLCETTAHKLNSDVVDFFLHMEFSHFWVKCDGNLENQASLSY